MALKKVRIGDYIELYSQKCNIPNLTVNDVSGINKEKEFFEPSKQIGKDTSNYKIVPPGYFACNLMHVGRDVVLPIAINRTEKNKIVSPAYTVFRMKNEDVILAFYLFILVNSTEKDRYFWFHCDSSVRDGMEWTSFCDIELEVPSVDVQEKYVNIYKGLLTNLKSYEKGLSNLKLVCDCYIEELRRNIKVEPIGPYIYDSSRKNESYERDIVGISNQQNLIPSTTRTSGVNKLKYLVLEPNEFAYSPIHINEGSIALNTSNNIFLVSPIYKTFKIMNNKLDNEYLMLWFSRKEFIRYCRFHAFGSARDSFEWSQMEQVKIPIPSLAIQKSIINIFKTMNERKKIIKKLKDIIYKICPILIRGAIEEAKGGN